MFLMVPQKTEAEGGNWGFGADLGMLTGTVDGSVFAMGLSADRYVDRAFSVGFEGFVTPASDLLSISGAAVLRFHIELEKANIVPFLGIGAIYQDLDRTKNNQTVNVDDTSHLIPIGASVEYPFNPNMAAGIKLTFNMHDLDFKTPVGKDTRSTTLTAHIRYRP
jgi:hypothetical protein